MAGSASIVTVTAGGILVLSTVRTAAFKVPKTACGGIARPPNCQSPVLLAGLVVVSVRKSAGNRGRAERSVPARSPTRLVTPTRGLVTPPGLLVKAESGKSLVVLPLLVFM